VRMSGGVDRVWNVKHTYRKETLQRAATAGYLTPVEATSPDAAAPCEETHGRKENDAHRGTRLLALMRDFSPKTVTRHSYVSPHPSFSTRSSPML
jgi:hypothetical protein